MERSEFQAKIETQAAHYFSEGYNCCQSMLLAANDLWELKLDSTLISAGRFFQHGMGSGLTCGALIGAQMVLGILDERYNTKLSNKVAHRLCEGFNQVFGSSQCSELRKKQSISDKLGYKGCKKITYLTAGIFYEFWENQNARQTTGICYYSNAK